jgi:paraquat-inducible protein B
MGKRISTNDVAESKTVSRYILDHYHSVQFSLNDAGPIYLFKLRDISLKGPCILVKEDSSVFRQLEVGDVLSMEFNPQEISVPNKLLKTQIISKNSHDLFTGHSLVGLSIIEESNL